MTGEADLAGFVRGLPKAELHLHIEGTLEPEMLVELAGRNGVELPFEDEAAVRAAYSFTDLQSFLDIYYQGAAVLQTTPGLLRPDGRVLAQGPRRRCAAGGDVLRPPDPHRAGCGIRRVHGGFTAAMADAEAQAGSPPRSSCASCGIFPAKPPAETFRAAEGWLDGIIGVGLDSSEVDHPPEDFAEAYAMARAAGLRPVAHAGEEGRPPTSPEPSTRSAPSGSTTECAARRIPTWWPGWWPRRRR